MTEANHQNQQELIDDTMEFFDEQFAVSQAINQPVIDQQLETLIQQSEFAKAQQERYLAEGVPAQQAAAQALTDLANTPEGEKYIADLTAAARAVGGGEGEQKFRQALEGYGISPSEITYLAELDAYETPEILTQRLEEGADYQNPEQVASAIQKLEDFDSTARVREAEGVAAGDVAISGEAARKAAMQQLESYGIDPSQLASGALDRTLRADTAAKAALASGQARRDIQSTGLQADVQAAGMAQQASLQQLQTQVDSATQLMQTRIQELQIQGLGAEEARLQADREIGYSQQLAQLDVAQRGEEVTYSGGASQEANRQQAMELAAGVDAYNLYANNPTQSATAFGTAGAAGGQASSIGTGAVQTGMGAYGQLSGMYGQQASSLQGGYNVANNIYGNNIASETARAESAAGPMELLGSLAGAAGGMAMMSDRRAKKDIKRVGQTDDGLPIYTYEMKGSDGPTQMGVMAQDLEKVSPEAVSTTPSGLKAVDYKKMELGGPVRPMDSPSGGAIPDDVKIAGSAGEYMFPKDVASWYGEEKLGKMVEKSRMDRQAGSQQRQQGGALPV